MMLQKVAFVNFLILFCAFTEVVSWTIDLPEVRKFLFEKNEKYKKEGKNNYEDYVNNEQTFYSNIEGNSKHNSEKNKHHEFDKEKYADEYDYHAYMEKKVYKIVRDGSAYLEGLRKSIEDYSVFLEDCNRRNSNILTNATSNNITWRPSYEPSPSLPSFNSSDTRSPILNSEDVDSSTILIWPKSDLTNRKQPSMRNGPSITCQEASEASEQVRRYAELALWATRRLQDLAYAKKHQKTDELEENELILKLAWFLDRLAYLTGFEPEHKAYEPRGTTGAPTVAPTALTLVPSSEELNKEMMDCLRRNSSEPATVRCRYPLEIPNLVAQILNSSDATTPSSPSDPNSVLPMTSSDTVAESSEILITADDSSPSSKKSKILKRSTEYTYYYPTKPLHEVTYPVPIVKLIKHRLSNIKSVVKTLVERRLAHIAEKKEENKHFNKRSIDKTNEETSNYIDQLSGVLKDLKKEPANIEINMKNSLYYPVSDVSIINTKSFKKRSIDDRRMLANHLNRLSNLGLAVKSVDKGPLVRKIIDNFVAPTQKAKQLPRSFGRKSLKKRFVDDPLSKLTNYYIKYKVWDNSNPIHIKKFNNKKTGTFEVKNHLNKPKKITKRSLFNKKVVHMHIPKPIQIVRTYIHGHRHHHSSKPKIVSHLQKLHNLKHKKLEKIHKNIKKRSLIYEHMYLPRIPMNPQGDISYYIKNKEGTNYNPSLTQAGQVRLGLEQAFQTGNIEVVRRFGSNYNPLNPAPFYTGILQSMADS